jgi:hypothetical protein
MGIPEIIKLVELGVLGLHALVLVGLFVLSRDFVPRILTAVVDLAKAIGEAASELRSLRGEVEALRRQVHAPARAHHVVGPARAGAAAR